MVGFFLSLMYLVLSVLVVFWMECFASFGRPWGEVCNPAGHLFGEVWNYPL